MPTMMKKSKFRLSRRIFPATPTKADLTVVAANSSLSDLAPIIEDFRFLDLPGEQRNEIYRYLFDDITTPNKEFQVWADQVPGYDGRLSAYGALARTCKHVFQEVSAIWTREYLPNLTLYFDDIRDFFRLCGPREPDAPSVTVASGLINTPTKFLLATPTDQHFTFFYPVCFPAYEIMRLMVGNIFCDNITLHTAYEYLGLGRSINFAKKTPIEAACEFHSVLADGDLEYRMVRHPRVPTYPHLKSFSRMLSSDIWSGQATETIEGRIRDLTWQGWHDDEDLHDSYMEFAEDGEDFGTESPRDDKRSSWCLTGWANAPDYARLRPLSPRDERRVARFWASVIPEHGGPRRCWAPDLQDVERLQ